MRNYIGLDVSNKETSICIVDENNKIIKSMKAKSDPDSIAQAINKTNLEITLIGMEAGALSYWLMSGLLKYNLPIKCIDSRRMAAIIKTNVNKTDKNDAKEIARAMRNGSYREVHQKSRSSMEIKVMMTSRKTVVEQLTNMKNTVRGLLKEYGIKLKSGLSNNTFVKEVEGQMSFDYFSPEARSTWDFKPIRVLLSCITKFIDELNQLDKEIVKLSKKNKLVKRFETIDGIGPITALSYIINIDDPDRFKHSRSVGAFIGLTSSQYSSGESIKQGRISKCGPKDLRALLVEAGVSILTHTTKWSKLKAFGLRIYRKTRSKMKAAVAIARKLAIIMHRMWINGTDFIHGEPSKKELKDTEKLQELIKNAKNKKQNPNEDSSKIKVA